MYFQKSYVGTMQKNVSENLHIFGIYIHISYRKVNDLSFSVSSNPDFVYESNRRKQ